MADRTQSYATHRRFFPLFHFVAVPLITLYTAYEVYALLQSPSLTTAAPVVLGAGVICAVLASRIMVLAVQDRVIHLEMRLRFARVFGAAAADAFSALTLRQLIALRFAPDAELPELVRRARANEFPTPRALKEAIREWQADFLRA